VDGQNGSQVVISLSGSDTEVDGVKISREQVFRAELPRSVSRQDIQVMRRDLELLAQIAEQHPDDFTDLHNAVLRQDFGTANRLAKKVGLSEEQFAAQDGGAAKVAIAGGILLVLVIVVVLSGPSDTGPTTPEPVGPGAPVDAGTGDASDAGTG
jgi:hypothetical protein